MRIEQRAINHSTECLELAKKLLGQIDSYKEIINLQKEIIDNLQQQNNILKRQVIAFACGETACPHG